MGHPVGFPGNLRDKELLIPLLDSFFRSVAFILDSFLKIH